MNIDNYHHRHIAMAQIALADKIEQDFVSKQGGLATYLLARARENAADAMLTLTTIDPNDTETIRKLQNDVQRHRELSTWMTEAVEDGRDAWNQLNHGEQEAIAAVINPQESDD